MLDALSNSSANIFASCEVWSWGGMINDPMLGPSLQATPELLMSCLTFQISTPVGSTGVICGIPITSSLRASLWQQRQFRPGAGLDVGHFGFSMSVPLFTFSSPVEDLKSIKTLKLPKTEGLVRRVKQTGLQ